jgi:hypothetical protein
MKHSEDKNIDKTAIAFLLYVFAMLGGIIFLLSLIITMPYNKWLEQLPVWAAIMSYIIFSICLVIMAFPYRSLAFNGTVGIIGILSALTLKTSMPKAYMINTTILLISVVLFLSIRYYFRQKLKKGDYKKETG